MPNKNLSHRDLAQFFADNREKEDIIPTIFDYFRLDCVERCNMNPSQFDELIRKFNEAEDCDVDTLTAIIGMIRAGQESAMNKENEMAKRIAAYIAEHQMEDTSIESMAEELNISYYYMCHIFKNKNGVSVNTYRTQSVWKSQCGGWSTPKRRLQISPFPADLTVSATSQRSLPK